MKKPFYYLGILLIALTSSLAFSACDKDEDEEQVEYTPGYGDDSYGGGGTETPQLTKPEFDKFLSKGGRNEFELAAKFTNGGDDGDNMTCKVHWKAYYPKPDTEPSYYDMEKHETMNVYYALNTDTKTAFRKFHTGYSRKYIYHYFECTNSKGTTRSPMSYIYVSNP